MAIITRDYFLLTETYLPHAKSNPSDAVTGVKGDIDAFIEKYEREVLIKTLGYSLFKEFTAELDSGEANGLLPTADVKWDYLLNGKEYPIGSTLFNFRGIRFTEGISNVKYSLIAYYVYYHYLKNDVSNYSTTGIQKESPANAVNVSAIPKAVKSWRSFYDLTQKDYYYPIRYNSNHKFYGVDYLRGNETERSLYQFISDQNSLVADTYENWEPFCFGNINNAGI